MKILIASGGSGGHVFPALSVASHLKNAEIVFLGTGRSGEERLVENGKGTLWVFSIGKLKGQNLFGVMKTVLKLPVQILVLAWRIRKEKIDFVFGVGGYTTGPAIVAAWMARRPRAVLELNARAGLANRISKFFCSRVYVNELAGRSGQFSNAKVVGTPLRDLKSPSEKYDLVITGGSQGATGLNKIVSQCILELEGIFPKILWQTGPKFDRGALPVFRNKVDIHEFVQDISQYFADAKIVISRAGANTIEELARSKAAVVLVPFRFAADDHQRANAVIVKSLDGSVVAEETISPKDFFEAVKDALNRHKELRHGIETLFHPNAAQSIAQDIQNIIA